MVTVPQKRGLFSALPKPLPITCHLPGAQGVGPDGAGCGTEVVLSRREARFWTGDQAAVVTCQEDVTEVRLDPSSLEYLREVPGEATHSRGELLKTGMKETPQKR